MTTNLGRCNVRRISIGPWLLAGLVAASPLSSGAAGKPGAKERTVALVEAFKAADGADEAAFRKVDGLFDYDRLTADAIRPHRAKLSAEQLERYAPVLRDLIRLVAYPDSGALLRKAKLTFGEPRTEGKAVSVGLRAELAAEDLEVDLLFQWEESAAGWRVVDVSFDGASLVTDYANQFGRIIGKEGAAGLMKRLEDKLAELRKGSGKTG